jgi:hypothetical protein
MTSKTSDSGDKGKVTVMQDVGGTGSGAEKAGAKKVTDTSGGIKFGTLREYLPSSPYRTIVLPDALPESLVKEKGALIGSRVNIYRSEPEDGRCQKVPDRHGFRTTEDPPDETTCACAYRASS